VIVEKRNGRRRTVLTREEIVELAGEQFDTLDDDVKEFMVRQVQEALKTRRLRYSELAVPLLYKRNVVSMKQFMEDDYFLGEACQTTYPKIKEDLIELFNGNYREVILSGSIGLDALVLESDGGLPSLRERIGVSRDVTTIRHEGAPSVSATEPGHHSGVKRVRHLRLANGAELLLTPDHEVQVVRGGRIEWVEAREIVKGDFVAHLRRWRVYPSRDASDDLVKLLAYWATDGSSSKTRARFCDGNPATSVEVMSVLERLGFAGKRDRKGKSWEVSVRRVKTSGFLDLLRNHALFGANTKTVCVPDVVCRCPNGKVALFLNRVWAAEGTCYTGNKKSPPRFSLGMSSERFVRQVQMMLLRFGVQARIGPTWWKRNGKRTKGWHLAVSGVDDLGRFLSSIGPILGKEKACAEIARYCVEKESNTNVDVVPMTGGEANDLLIEHGVRRPASSPWWSLATRRNSCLSRKLFSAFLEEFGECPAVARLADRYHEDVGFSRVVVNEDGGEVEVGDIGAIDGHRFVANGVGVHNSIGWGKCLSASTEYYDPAEGRRYTVGERSGPVSVVAHHDGRAVVAEGRIECTGMKVMGDLVFASGRRVRMSPDHPVLTQEGFVPAGDLREQHLVATVRSVPAPSLPLMVPDEEVEFVAFMLAEGSCSSGNWTFTNADAAVLTRFSDCAVALHDGWSESGVTVKESKGKMLTVYPRGTKHIQRRYGLFGTSHEKRVPAEFYGLDDRQLALFLNRIWACDGSLYVGSPAKVEITLASESFIRDLQFLLLRFGVHGRSCKVKKRYTHNGERRESDAWRLTITSKDEIARFLAAVGPVLSKEAACAELAEIDTSCNPNVDVTPVNIEVLRDIRREVGPILRGQYWPGMQPGQRMSVKRLARVRELYGLPEKYRWWPDVFWDRVVEYEVGTVAEPAYDIEVPSVANFAPSGIVVHNTTFLSIALARVLYELSCLSEPQLTFGLSPGSEMGIVLVSKNLPLARRVLKTAIDDKLKLSPYFQEQWTPKIASDVTHFPDNIVMTIGSYLSERLLGVNVFAGAMDECLGKKALLTIRNGVTSVQKSVADLLSMGSACRDGLLVEALDHETGKRAWVPFRMRKSTVQPLVRIGSHARAVELSLEHPVLVRRGDWLVYAPAGEIRVGDEAVWRRSDAEKGRARVGGDAEEDLGCCQGENGGEEPILGEVSLGGDEGEDPRGKAGEEARASLGGDEAQDLGSSEGEEVQRGDAAQDERSGEEASTEGGHRVAASYARSGQPHVWEDAHRGDAGEVATCSVGEEGVKVHALEDESVAGGASSFRGNEGRHFSGECLGHQGSRSQAQVHREVAGRRGHSVPHDPREESCGTSGEPGWGRQRSWRGPDGVRSVHDRRSTEADGRGLLGHAHRRDEGARGGEGCDLLLQGAGTSKTERLVEVVPGKRSTIHLGHQQAACSECVDRSVRDGSVHGERARSQGSIPHHADGRALGGCRPECLAVADLPPEFVLARVERVDVLPPEQTYSIETACQTFVADGCVVHNTNFATSNREQIHRASGERATIAHYDIAEKVYTTLLRRIKSRFQRSGDLTGMMILASSATTEGGFTDRRIKEAGNDPQCLVLDHALWDVKPRSQFGVKWFRVLAGGASLRSRILGDDEEIPQEFLKENNAKIIEVPEDFRYDFERNLPDSLRDIAGLPTQAITAFLERVEAIDKCVVDRDHPFSVDEWQYGSPGRFEWEKICLMGTRRLPGGYEEQAWKPIRNPHQPRWIHVDTSLSGDATGMAMGHIERWVEVVRRNSDGDTYTDLAPYVVMDLMLRVIPPPGEQIYLPDVRRLIYELVSHGFTVFGCSFDSYQSAEMQQKLRAKGLVAKEISVDRTTAPYDALKSAIYEERLEIYRYEAFISELKALEYDRVKGKVDHPLAGSKDVSDAVAGVVFGLQDVASRLPLTGDAGRTVKTEADQWKWVSQLVPAENVDRETVERQRQEDENIMPMPFLMGDIEE